MYTHSLRHIYLFKYIWEAGITIWFRKLTVAITLQPSPSSKGENTLWQRTRENLPEEQEEIAEFSWAFPQLFLGSKWAALVRTIYVCSARSSWVLNPAGSGECWDRSWATGVRGGGVWCWPAVLRALRNLRWMTFPASVIHACCLNARCHVVARITDLKEMRQPSTKYQFFAHLCWIPEENPMVKHLMSNTTTQKY